MEKNAYQQFWSERLLETIVKTLIPNLEQMSIFIFPHTTEDFIFL